MDYLKLHDSIINQRKIKGPPEGYSEKHHIIPKSFGGSDEKENLIRLTAKEHFIVHRLLAKIYPETGMVHAIWKMSCINKETKRYRISSKTYEFLRKKHAERVSNDKESALKKSETLKGRPQSNDHIRNRTESRKNNGPWLKEETKKKIGNSNKGKTGTWAGKKLPDDLIKRRNESRFANGNYGHTKETRQKISNSQKGLKRGPKSEEAKSKQRKQYLVNDSIIVDNAKQFCKDNGIHYQKFISAANGTNKYKEWTIIKLTEKFLSDKNL